MEVRKASSSTAGFFQSLPVVPPQYTAPLAAAPSLAHEISDDTVLSRILSLYLPSPLPSAISNHLHSFSRLVLHASTLQYTVDCDTTLPTLRPLTTFGEQNKIDSLRTSEGWRELKKIQTPAGVIGYGYPQPNGLSKQDLNRRTLQYATLHLWQGTSAVATCPVAMSDGAAVLLRQHLEDPDGDQPGRSAVLRESFNRLISLDNNYAWTSGQWMTERSGGSDVRGTETIAHRMTAQELQADVASNRDKDAHGLPLGPWLIDGFKWFSSATDADMAVLLAQTSTGLSAFYAPLRRRTGTIHNLSSSSFETTLTTEVPSSETNGIRIQRLKSKLGTKGVPTAELELRSMRAYLIGTEGQGIKEISSILNITRLHTASSSAGYWARGLAVSRSYTLVRRIRGGQLLRDNAAHLAWLAGESVKYRAATHFLFLGVALLGASEQSQNPAASQNIRAANTLIPSTKRDQERLLRLLTPVIKAQVSLAAVAGLRACMESLGGVGYCENNEDGGILNIARLFRDCAVNPIWEGTTSVMAEDVLRVIKNPRVQGTENVLDDTFGSWMRNILQVIEDRSTGLFSKEISMVRNRYAVLEKMVRTTEVIALQRHGRAVLEHIEAVACACLLMFDALVDGDDVTVEIARRWVGMKALPQDIVEVEESTDVMKDIEMDRRIFLGAVAATGSSNMSIQAKL